MGTPRTRTPDASRPDSAGLQNFGALALTFLVLLAYANSLTGDFVMDDRREILHNPDIRRLWPPWDYLGSQRPLVEFTLALNYAIGSTNVRGYHAVNIVIHILASLTLFGLIRRTLCLAGERSPITRRTALAAFVAALIWALHPLQTQSVTYLIQRAESLMGLFYLLTLYCVARGFDSARTGRWFAAAVVCSAAGMAAKAVMVTAPLAVWLFDRCFVSRSFSDALRRHGALYLGLCLSTAVLWFCGVAPGILSTSREVATVGFSFKGISPLEYGRTQPGVILHYLLLSLWPHPLCLDYEWPVAGGVASIVPAALLVSAFLVVAVGALPRQASGAFLIVLFFLVLLPTSSFIPIKDILFEHRMYLPLAAVLIALTAAGFRMVEWLEARRLRLTRPIRAAACLAVVGVIASLALRTVVRNRDYGSPLRMWQDVATRRPDNIRAHANLGSALLRAGRISDALFWYGQAVHRAPADAPLRSNYATALFQAGREKEALDEFRAALRLQPDLLSARCNLAHALLQTQSFDEAADHCRIALAADDTLADMHLTLGQALAASGRPTEALPSLRRACAIAPTDTEAHFHLALVLVRLGHRTEAIALLESLLRISPGHAGAREVLDELGRRR